MKGIKVHCMHIIYYQSAYILKLVQLNVSWNTIPTKSSTWYVFRQIQQTYVVIKVQTFNMYTCTFNSVVSLMLSSDEMYLQQISRCQSTHEVKLKNKLFIVCFSSPKVYIEGVFHKASFDIRIPGYIKYDQIFNIFK